MGLIFNQTGVFYSIPNLAKHLCYDYTGTKENPKTGFDLSKGNSIYSGSTIRPKAISVLVLLRL